MKQGRIAVTASTRNFLSYVQRHHQEIRVIFLDLDFQRLLNQSKLKLGQSWPFLLLKISES